MSYKRLTIAMLVAFSVLRLAYLFYSPFAISPDEAHYWEWSRRLAPSYYSKGPGVAYAIAFFTSIFGANEFGIRIGAVFFSALAGYVLYLLGEGLFKSPRTGFYSALLINITPIYSIGSILMTTDVLLVFFWSLTVLCVWKALNDNSGGGWWYAAGLSGGFGFLGKYTIALLFPSVVLFLIFSKREKKWLKRPEPYGGGLLALLAVTPVIYWNIVNGQVTIRHTMGQAHLGGGTLSLGPLFEFIGSQIGLITPLIFAGLAYGLYRSAKEGLKDGGGPLLAFFTGAPVLLFFIFESVRAKVQANWAVASFITAFPASVWAFENLYGRAGQSGKRALRVLAVLGISLGVVGTIIAYFPSIIEPVAKRIITGPPYNRVTGWRELGDKVSEVKSEMEKNGRVFVASDTYQITSELAFYTEGNPVAYNFNTGGRRMNQYDLWPGYNSLKGYDAVYVKGGVAGAEGVVLDAFDRCEKEVFTVYRDKRPLKEFSVFRCFNFKGLKEQGVDRY
ncbi:MAG: glycosyltransferase family 39 protein [Deltaproteobacteria bacterium]|nr:glycosyltransferase family 39 protein [Deltaproteobacteria bacterium]